MIVRSPSTLVLPAALLLAALQTVAPGRAMAFRGDGFLDPGEICDDGNAVNGDGCETTCALSPGCALYPAPMLPRAIPDLGSLTSFVVPTQPGTVREVEVVGLRGTHTYVSDLRFRLTSPGGVDVTPTHGFNVFGLPAV